jgi:manganese/zinc/iron transport system permease protein
MNTLIPPFDARAVFVEPWTDGFPVFGWVWLMGFLVAALCGVAGNYLILRRMALMGDAVSHSVLPGLALAFLAFGSRGTGPMLAGALFAAVATTGLIELLHRPTRLKPDAATGIVFTCLFAAGVVLISLFADRVDLDQDCVLHGELAQIPFEPFVRFGGLTLGPPSVLRMACAGAAVLALIALFYKELLVSSFDPALARCAGIRTGLVHHGLMAGVSVLVVFAFQSVGAILVIAMLILPGATAAFVSDRLPGRMAWSVVHAAISATAGLHLALWLDCSIAGAIVVAGGILFMVAWGIVGLRSALRRRSTTAELPS